MKTFEEWLEEELKVINLGNVSEHEEGLLRVAYEAGMNAQKEPVAKLQCSDGLDGLDDKKPTPQDDPFRWMETWLLAYDKEHGGDEGVKIMAWIWTAP